MPQHHTSMTARYLLFISALALVACAAAGSAHEGAPAAWRLRVDKASALADEEDRESFHELLQLLLDEHPDVSYAAAEAIEKRSQVEYLDAFINTIRKMPIDRRWYAYRALRSYPSRASLVFLASSMKEEFERISPNEGFDSRNCYYINQSIQSIVQGIEAKQTGPDEETAGPS